MANNCSDTLIKLTKCSDSRKRPPLRSWIWCILIKCVIGLPCILSECLGVNISVATYPDHTLSVRYGDPLEIFCVAEKFSSDDLRFMLAGKFLESERINETTRRLYIKKPEIQLSSYYCRNNKTGKVCISRVLVDVPPTNVTDFSCISMNLDILKCSWTRLVTDSVVNYTLTFVIEGNRAEPPCTAITEEIDGKKTAYCSWNTTSIPRYRQLEATLNFFLRACNIFGCNEQNFSIDHHSIVKPDPPFDLDIVKNGTHGVDLKWNIPFNMDLLSCGVEHIIEYQIAKIDNTTFFHQVDTSALHSKNGTYKFRLRNLPYAHMQYEVRIYIKSKKALSQKYWSNFSYILFYTASEKPSRPPAMITGAFDQAIYAEKRFVYVYWKQLEEYEEAGANFTYKVLITQGNNTFPIIYSDRNKSLGYVFTNVSFEALHVNVWSVNANGPSVNSSHLYIPAKKDTESLVLTSFTKVAYENGTYELSWVGIKNIDNYTLFWCHYNVTKICSGRIDFAVLDPKNNTHVINLPREYKYQFAISANKGSKTSGMVWAKCDISKDGFVMYKFPVQLTYDIPGKSSVNIKWGMDCALQEGLITGYNISYCPVVLTSSNCDKSYENKHKFISGSNQTSVLIENLLPFKTYQFTLAINTTYGQKNIENATARITTSEDTPTRPINVGVSDVKNNSLVISWDPPLQRNGIIGKYIIYNYTKQFIEEGVSGTDLSRRQVTLTGLKAFTNYSLTVKACNIPLDVCSEPGPDPPIFVRTRIGSPSTLELPSIKSKPNMLVWKAPSTPGGTVDLYEIRRMRDDIFIEILNTTDLNYPLSVHCEGEVSTEAYQVRAVNFDQDYNHGVISIGNVTVPKRMKNDTLARYSGEWSPAGLINCTNKGGLTITVIFMGIIVMIGVVYGSVKFYKKYRKMEDIKPVLPNGLGIPEKDISKYAFGGWNPNNKDEKPSSDEMLLLPNSKTSVSTLDNKQKNDICAASDHTDSTALSDSSKGPVDRQASTSDDGSNSSLHLEGEPVTTDDKNASPEKNLPNVESDGSREGSPYFPKAFTKNPASGYVQPVVNSATGYVQSTPAPVKISPPTTSSQPAGSSYVMAALAPPIFSTGLTQAPMSNPPTPSSGYVLPEEAQTRSMTNFPKLGPTKGLGPESLPTMPSLPPPTKHGADTSYIQLQSLDALPSLKPQVRNNVPLKPPTSSGYVSPGDVVINKHLNNMLSGGQLADESAILDPTMSPDAYCRFSWSTDPVNDNLHSFLADSTTRTSTKN